MGIVVAGITGMSSWQEEKILTMSLGQTTSIQNYSVTLKAVKQITGPNYDATRAIFDFSLGEKPIATLNSERRFYQVRRSQTTEAGIHSNGIYNLYVALGETSDDGKWVVRLYYHPFAPWIWIGPLIMALGGFVSLSDRRFRIGMPQRSRARLAAVIPAE
jgi:cytochrome c-type biogenesis protein CcmF